MADDLKLDAFDRLDRAEETLARFGYKWSEEQCQYVAGPNSVPSVAANNPTSLPGAQVVMTQPKCMCGAENKTCPLCVIF